MSEPAMLQLAQELEWLGCELEYLGHKHALEGFPEAGATWDTFREKQRGVLVTADKVERELKTAVRFNPQRLVGVEFPLDATLNSVAALLQAVEDIKVCAVYAVQQLPRRVRAFTKTVEAYLLATGAMRG
jgi:hypothetical protein